MKHPDDQYVTMHATVLQKIVTDIVECVRKNDWTDEDVESAIQGAFITIRRAGGTVEDVDHFAQSLGAKPVGAPKGATKH